MKGKSKNGLLGGDARGDCSCVVFASRLVDLPKKGLLWLWPTSRLSVNSRCSCLVLVRRSSDTVEVRIVLVRNLNQVQAVRVDTFSYLRF